MEKLKSAARTAFTLDTALDSMTFSEFVRDYRHRCDLSQPNLAQILGVSAAYMSQIEGDKKARPPALAAALYRHLKRELDKKQLESIWAAGAVMELRGQSAIVHRHSGRSKLNTEIAETKINTKTKSQAKAKSKA